jgi:sortase A
LTALAGRGGPVSRLVAPSTRPRRGARTATAAGDAAAAAALSSPAGTRRHRRAVALALLLALAGAGSFGHGAWLDAKACVGQWLLERAWARMRAGEGPVPPWPWADLTPLARLTAPRAGADVLILADASGRTLAWGPGHLDLSASLGQPGNAIVLGHRDSHFRFLRTLQAGDVLVLELADGAHRHYRVRERYVADVRSLVLPVAPPGPMLTLITCYPFDTLLTGGPLRLVVIAEPA